MLIPSILRADFGGIITPPAGPNKSVQFNKHGVFGGDITLTFDTTTKTMSVTSMTATGTIIGTFQGDGSRLTGLPMSPGGGGSASLAIGTGSAVASNIVSSPTAIINFDSSTFIVQLKGGATAYVSLGSLVALLNSTQSWTAGQRLLGPTTFFNRVDVSSDLFVTGISSFTKAVYISTYLYVGGYGTAQLPSLGWLRATGGLAPISEGFYFDPNALGIGVSINNASVFTISGNSINMNSGKYFLASGGGLAAPDYTFVSDQGSGLTLTGAAPTRMALAMLGKDVVRFNSTGFQTAFGRVGRLSHSVYIGTSTLDHLGLFAVGSTVTVFDVWPDSTAFKNAVTFSSGIVVGSSVTYLDRTALSGLNLAAPDSVNNANSISPILEFYASGDSDSGAGVGPYHSSMTIRLQNFTFPLGDPKAHKLAFRNTDDQEVFNIGYQGIFVRSAAGNTQDAGLFSVGATTMVVLENGNVGLGNALPSSILDINNGSITLRGTNNGIYVVNAGSVSAMALEARGSTISVQGYNLVFASAPTAGQHLFVAQMNGINAVIAGGGDNSGTGGVATISLPLPNSDTGYFQLNSSQTATGGPIFSSATVNILNSSTLTVRNLGMNQVIFSTSGGYLTSYTSFYYESSYTGKETGGGEPSHQAVIFNSAIQINHTKTDPSGSYPALRVSAIMNPVGDQAFANLSAVQARGRIPVGSTSAVSSLTGVDAFVTNDGTGTVFIMTGAGGWAENRSTSVVSYLVGLDAIANNTHATSTVGSINPLYIDPTNGKTLIQRGVVTNFTGIRISGMNVESSSNNNRCIICIDSMTGTPNISDFMLNSLSTAPSVLSGPLTVSGVTIPTPFGLQLGTIATFNSGNGFIGFSSANPQVPVAWVVQDTVGPMNFGYKGAVTINGTWFLKYTESQTANSPGAINGVNNGLTIVYASSPGALGAGLWISNGLNAINWIDGGSLNFPASAELTGGGYVGIYQGIGSHPAITGLSAVAQRIGIGNVTNMRAFKAQIIDSGGQGTLTNVRTFVHVRPTSVTGSIWSNTCAVCIDTANPTAGTLTNPAYGIYEPASVNINWIAGRVGIGTRAASPTSGLDVVDDTVTIRDGGSGRGGGIISATVTVSGIGAQINISTPSVAIQAARPTSDYGVIYSSFDQTTSTAEVFVMDGGGNRTKISPHNSKGDWVFDSRNKNGQAVYINMERFIRDYEKLTGHRYVFDNEAEEEKYLASEFQKRNLK